MKFNKKGQQAAAARGFGTLVDWAIVIGPAIAVIFLIIKFTDFGKTAWAKITDIRAFV